MMRRWVGGQEVRIRCRHFDRFLSKGYLFDLGGIGDKFTWSNRHEDTSFTKERLDKVLANKKWLDFCSYHQATHLL